MPVKNLIISNDIEEKLKEKHTVSRREVEQCFENKRFSALIDIREEHKTNPSTEWFLERTNQGRILKIVYIQQNNKIYLKTAYPANSQEIDIYSRLCGTI